MGWNEKIKTHVCPTLREADGLAMSSRNMRLSEQERKTAPAIFKTLSAVQSDLKPGNIESLKKTAIHILQKTGFKVDYISITDAATLHEVENWDGKQKLVVLVAAYLNEVRLIDNLELN